MIKIPCPGCGKELHFFFIPSAPGTYRVTCQSDSTKQIVVKIDEDGQITEEESEKEQ